MSISLVILGFTKQRTLNGRKIRVVADLARKLVIGTDNMASRRLVMCCGQVQRDK